MTALDEKLKYFKDKQAEMLALDAEIKPKAQQLQAEFDGKMQELYAPLNAKGQTYRAELKAFCGITDGEKTNVLELLGAFAKLSEFKQ